VGSQLEDVLDALMETRAPKAAGGKEMRLGVSTLPPLPRDQSDRNRTSPFAFTGNKFEFRAVGSSQNIAGPNTVLNTIVAESMDFIATQLEKETAGGKDLNKAIQELLTSVTKEGKKVLFNGDNYTAEWHAEAQEPMAFGEVTFDARLECDGVAGGNGRSDVDEVARRVHHRPSSEPIAFLRDQARGIPCDRASARGAEPRDLARPDPRIGDEHGAREVVDDGGILAGDQAPRHGEHERLHVVDLTRELLLDGVPEEPVREPVRAGHARRDRLHSDPSLYANVGIGVGYAMMSRGFV
jgi:hypothetical protein